MTIIIDLTDAAGSGLVRETGVIGVSAEEAKDRAAAGVGGGVGHS
jgi:hypothetical protein